MEKRLLRARSRAVARIDAGGDCIYMGNLDSLRDWGHARDYVEMQWLMLQQQNPEDFVIATGHQEGVRRFIEITAYQLGWGLIQWEGEGLSELGRRADTGAVVVRIDPRYFRPAGVETLLGDPSNAKEKLGWTLRSRLSNSWLRWLLPTCRMRKKRHISNVRVSMLSVQRETLINYNDRFAIFGARGMAGSAISRTLARSGYRQQFIPSRSELDLLDLMAVQKWFKDQQPSIVVLAAAKVGGMGPTSYPSIFCRES